MTSDAARDAGTDADVTEQLESTPEPERRQRSVPALLIVFACVLALVGATWWAGGFGPATGRLLRLPPGTVVNLGPMSIAVDRALVRQSSSGWTLYVFARCQNNSDDPLESSKDRLAANGFGAQHPISREIADDASLFFGAGETLGKSSVLNPGTPMVPCQIAFTFKDFPATDVVSVGASELEWIDRSPTGEGEMVWSAGRVGYRFEVPVVTDPTKP